MRGHSCWPLHLCFMVHVAMGMVYYVLMGCFMDVGEMLRDADGVSWLLCICPEVAGGSRMQSTWENYLGVKMEWDAWAG